MILSVHCKYYTYPKFNTTFSVSKKISIMHANIRSSEANLKEFTYYLNDLNIEFIFIILYETWAKEHNTDMHIIIMTIIQLVSRSLHVPVGNMGARRGGASVGRRPLP